MDLQKLKSATEVNLAGIACDFERVDGNLKRVKLRDKAGRTVSIQLDGYYDLTVVAPKPPEKVTRFALSGEVVEGVPFRKLFDKRTEAERTRAELADKLSLDEDAAKQRFSIDEVVTEEGAVDPAQSPADDHATWF